VSLPIIALYLGNLFTEDEPDKAQPRREYFSLN